jgi:gamma-glutamyltranspeptidase/glutathione hydrolase
MEREENPFNVLEPGKRPRATLSPGLALRGGRPYLSFAVQGGDAEDQNLLQFFLNVVEFGMDVQEAAEAANINSYQMHNSFGTHRAQPGRLVVRDDTPRWVQNELIRMGYRVESWPYTSGPINAVYFDQVHGTLWGGSSDSGDDYGLAW